MRDYFETVRNFSAVDLERRTLAGSLCDGVNACVECCDRWAKNGAIALEWYSAKGERRTVTFKEMSDHAGRFANYLQSQGIGNGDVVAGISCPASLTYSRSSSARGASARYTSHSSQPSGLRR